MSQQFVNSFFSDYLSLRKGEICRFDKYSRGMFAKEYGGRLARRIKQICKGYIEWDADEQASFVEIEKPAKKKQKTKSSSSSSSSELTLTLEEIIDDAKYLKDNVKGFGNGLGKKMINNYEITMNGSVYHIIQYQS